MTKQITPEQIKQILQLKIAFTTNEVAKQLNLTPSCVNYWLRQLRIKSYTIPRQKAGRKPIKF